MVSKLSEDVFEQIKDFSHGYLIGEQKSLVDKLIQDEELRERYKKNGLCHECKQPYTGFTEGSNWCQPCNAKHLQKDFNKWTSGNKEIDEFIQNLQLTATCKEEILEWIPYDRIKDVEYLSRGGFGIVYKAKLIDGFIIHRDVDQNEWSRYGRDKEVVLKSLNNSQNITADFLQEITLHKKITSASFSIVKCYGVSQDPKTKNFMMVIDFVDEGSASQYIKNNYDVPKLLDNNLFLFADVTNGLKAIHSKGFIHKDFHSGNVLVRNYLHYFISDLGLCKPADEQTEGKKIYGILPYVAPEVLKGKTYTQAADIYSFGIVACEMLSGSPPYHDLPHNEILALKICQGLRPRLNDNIKIPLMLKNLIYQCLDADPSKRPTAEELSNTFNKWRATERFDSSTEFYKQYIKAKEFNNSISKSNMPLNTTSTIHPQAIYSSRPLDYKNLPRPQNSEEINTQFYLTTSEYSLNL